MLPRVIGGCCVMFVTIVLVACWIVHIIQGTEPSTVPPPPPFFPRITSLHTVVSGRGATSIWPQQILLDLAESRTSFKACLWLFAPTNFVSPGAFPLQS